MYSWKGPVDRYIHGQAGQGELWEKGEQHILILGINLSIVWLVHGQFSTLCLLQIHEYFKSLDRIVKTFNYYDCFRYLHPIAREFTFQRGEHVAQSRLDRVYIPPHLLPSLVSARHKPGVSDHCQIEVKMRLGAGQTRPNNSQKKSFWKLNTSLLDNPDFKKQFQTLYG